MHHLSVWYIVVSVSQIWRHSVISGTLQLESLGVVTQRIWLSFHIYAVFLRIEFPKLRFLCSTFIYLLTDYWNWLFSILIPWSVHVNGVCVLSAELIRWAWSWSLFHFHSLYDVIMDVVNPKAHGISFNSWPSSMLLPLLLWFDFSSKCFNSWFYFHPHAVHY